jgi:CHASE3 domain sensor protein
MEPTIGKIANIAFGLVLVILTVNGWVSYYNIQQLAEREFWVNHTHQVLARLDSALAALNEAESDQRG